jgi:ParB family chromosome partitioning protein
LIENLQREDLNPIEEAESLKRLKDRRNLTDHALARIIG